MYHAKPCAKLAEGPEPRQSWSTDGTGDGRYLWSGDKKSLTLSFWIAQIYTTFCWDALFTHRNLDEAEHLLQQTFSDTSFLSCPVPGHPGIIWMRQGKPEQVLAPLDEAIGGPL
jgi:hypothetical protein